MSYYFVISALCHNFIDNSNKNIIGIICTFTKNLIMDIQAEINWIHQEIDKVKDPTFVEKLKRLLLTTNSPQETSNTDYNIDIEKALESIEKGNFHTEDEAIAISKKWGRK